MIYTFLYSSHSTYFLQLMNLLCVLKLVMQCLFMYSVCKVYLFTLLRLDFNVFCSKTLKKIIFSNVYHLRRTYVCVQENQPKEYTT